MKYTTDVMVSKDYINISCIYILVWLVCILILYFFQKVFKYGLSGYQPYQRLPSYGVVAQESIYIGDDLYLLLLSEFTHTLDVYENSPTEVI